MFNLIKSCDFVHEYQANYYRAIKLSTQKTDSSPFIEFMLSTILDTIQSTNPSLTPQVAPQVTPQVKALLHAMLKNEEPFSREALQSALNLKDRKSFRERYLKPALELELVEMSIPEKPNSRLQRYRITALGKECVGQEV